MRLTCPVRPKVTRVAACELSPDSDLGDRRGDGGRCTAEEVPRSQMRWRGGLEKAMRFPAPGLDHCRCTLGLNDKVLELQPAASIDRSLPMPEVKMRKTVLTARRHLSRGRAGGRHAAPARAIMAVIEPLCRALRGHSALHGRPQAAGPADGAKADRGLGRPRRHRGLWQGRHRRANGELEHGALWHVPGGYAMRELLGDARAIVPSTKKVGGVGARLDVPVTHVNASYVRGHFDAMEVGCADAPKADELALILVMTTGARVHDRMGGLKASEIKGEDGLR
jgi:hypothetical protein